MKIYEEKTVSKKSWSIGMDQVDLEVRIQAVNSDTGSFICNLIIFEENGDIYTSHHSKSILTDNGYDPCEHGNAWCSDGAIRIEI